MLVFLFCAHNSLAQNSVIRGSVQDAITLKPISNAFIEIDRIDEKNYSVTDTTGSFDLRKLSPGTYNLFVSAVGYDSRRFSDLEVKSGKEFVISIDLYPGVNVIKEVEITAQKRSTPSLNGGLVSARSLNIDQAQRYAGNFQDPLRALNGTAGVFAASDDANQMIIRGNAPNGLLWQMEGADVPNPNHFANAGSSGGLVSMLSVHLVNDADFYSGAFPAVYQNALSAVFDLKLRRGNDQKRENSVQAGFQGLSMTSEGPFASKGSSYLISYRYSTLGFLQKVKIINVADAVNFQDLSYHIFLKGKNGCKISLFGFNGISDMGLSNANPAHEEQRQHTFFNAVKWERHLKSNSSLQSIFSFADESDANNEYGFFNNQQRDVYKHRYHTNTLRLNNHFTSKVNQLIFIRAGISAATMSMNYMQQNLVQNKLQTTLEEKTSNVLLLKSYMQLNWKITNSLNACVGGAAIFFSQSKKAALDPRLTLRYSLKNNSSLSFGSGLHSQIQPLGVYFAKEVSSVGSQTYPNKNLGMSRAFHNVISYKQAFKHINLTAEMYHQLLYNIPVSPYAGNNFSMLNVLDGYVSLPLVNKGSGNNYGLELTLEKKNYNYFYYTVSQSFFKSSYKGIDNISHPTRFSGNFITSIAAGKDWINNTNTHKYGVNTHILWAGGMRTSAILLDSTLIKKEIVYDDQQPYKVQLPNYFRIDVKVFISFFNRKSTSTISLDVQNITNRRNVRRQYYNESQNNVAFDYMLGLIPVLNYRLDF